MPDLARLTALARSLLPASAAVAAADPRAALPRDPDTPSGALPKREREFASGRAAARAALATLGYPAARIPMSADRAPCWPQGATGSITHSATACLAAAARMTDLTALGLDLEPDRPLAEDLWDTVLLPAERAALPGSDAGRQAMLIFSAKEAAYKAQFPLSRCLFGFDMLQVSVAPGMFTATFRHPAGPFAAGSQLTGRWGRGEGHILAAVALR